MREHFPGKPTVYNLTNYSGCTVRSYGERFRRKNWREWIRIWEFDADEAEEVNISYSLTVTSGKAKLVYVSPDGIVSTLAEMYCRERGK